MAKRNYYEILGVSQIATQEEIKNAYRIQAKKWHPDINLSPNAENIMKTINEAYEVLSNLSLRQRYDDKLSQENKISSSFTQSQNQSEQYTYYDSYTKSRKESEHDFDEWIKEYLKKERSKHANINKEDFNKFDMESLKLLKEELLKFKKGDSSINIRNRRKY